MKNHFLIMLLIGQLAFVTKIYAQNIAINGTGNLPDTSAMLDISSTNKGFLAPRMTTIEQNAIPLPANGLLIFNTTDNLFKVNTGIPAAPVWTNLVTATGGNTNTLGSATNTMTSTINGVAANAPIVNTVSNTSATNTLTTRVNSVAATGVTIINSNTLTNPVNTITSTINGVTATAAAVNTTGLSLTGSTLTSTVNGVPSTGLNLSPAVAAATTNTMSSSANNLTTTVNGVSATPVTIINSNVLSLAGSNLTSTVNGVASTALALPFLSSMNGLTPATQTFATGSSGNNFAISSSGSVHSFNLPDASVTARGVVTTGAQTFAGNKIFNGTVTAASLPGGAATDSLVTTDATGLLKKRTIASVVAGNVWGTFGNSPVNSGNMFFGSVNDASLRFRSFNVERMVLDSVGNVGFGTPTPKKPIDIVTNLPAQGGLMQFRNTAPDGYTSIDLQNELGTQVGNIGWSNTLAGSFPNSFYFSTNIAAPMFFATAATERMRITATGNVGIGVSVPTAALHLEAGTATAGTAPLKISDGVLLTAIEKGAIEKDANVFYLTPDAVNRGVLPAVSYSVLGADYTLTNGTAAQAVFSAGQDNIDVSASTTYEFEAQYILTTGTTNHTTSTLFAGTATFTSISYIGELSNGNANTATTNISKTNVNTSAVTALNGSVGFAETVIQLKGIMRVNAAGTLIPQIKFSASPGGTNRCLTNSYFKLTPIGTNAVTKIGSWL